MAVIFPYAASLSGKLLNPCRLLGLMQTVHTSAVGCCFHRITCYFLQNCSCNIFLSVAWHIIHLQFHFSIKVYLILQLIPFKCWNSDTACNFSLRKCAYRYFIYILLIYAYLATHSYCWNISNLCVKIILERKLYICQTIVFVNLERV